MNTELFVGDMVRFTKKHEEYLQSLEDSKHARGSRRIKFSSGVVTALSAEKTVIVKWFSNGRPGRHFIANLERI
jgi:hypothetical protein